MPEIVTYDAQAKLMHVRAWGTDTIEDWLSSRKQAIQLHRTHGAVQLLVDVSDQETSPAITDIFDFGKNWPARIRTTILVGEKPRKETQFLETVAVNRAKQWRIFDDEEDALNWLRE